MSDLKVIEAVRNGEMTALKALLAGRANVDEQDEQGWTPLCWAAGRGDAEAVTLLLDHGADFTRTGRDRRTPLMIASAADRKEVVAILSEAEKKAGTRQDPRETKPYCKAYYLKDMRRFPGWSESRVNWQESAGEGDGEFPLPDNGIVYLHQDYTVTKSMWHKESVIFDQVTAGWREFCESELGFTGSEAPSLDLPAPAPDTALDSNHARTESQA